MKALVLGFHLPPEPWTTSQSGAVGRVFSEGGIPLPLAILAFKTNMEFLKWHASFLGASLTGGEVLHRHWHAVQLQIRL